MAKNSRTVAEEAESNEPSEESQESLEQARSTRGADAAVAAVRPSESQVRGSFMPGGGAGEDATTEVDPETHAQFPTTATAEEKEQARQEAREKAQREYERDVNDGNVRLAVARPGTAANPAGFDS
jgi:hypothetical protein